MVVEDLHWADPAMLEFLDHLVGPGAECRCWCSARRGPELFTQHPSWGSGARGATIISLSPLSDEDMQVLSGALLLRSVVPDERAGR